MKPGLLAMADRTGGTAGYLARRRISTIHVDKFREASYDPVKLIEDGRIDLVIFTPAGGKARCDGRLIRRTATRHGNPTVTTAAGGMALVLSIESARTTDEQVVSLQDHHRSVGL